MRVLAPTEDGLIDRDGIRVFYEVYGQGAPTILLLPTWSLVHSRRWKMQIPYLARHFRVVTFDGRGNGGSDRPQTAAAYADTEFARDAVAVLDTTRTDAAIIVSISRGSGFALRLAAEYPERVLGAVFTGPSLPLGEPNPDRAYYASRFEEALETDQGWAKFNQHYWRRDYPGFADWFCAQVFNEPHSTKAIEDCTRWALETDPETLLLTRAGAYIHDAATVQALAERIRCPVLVVHGIQDDIVPVTAGIALAEALDADLVLFDGSGHAPDGRDPVKFNLLLREFVERIHPPGPRRRTWTRAHVRPRRALFISSPIGLGHARRDVAIADELRQIHPDLKIDWLAQHPVTEVLQARGESIHPASADLASESAHIEAEAATAGDHALHAFEAFRRMDEILLANFMVFRDLVAEEPYDLWIGDEAWEVDHFLHENPEEKRAAYAWLTDFVGFLPLPEGGEREASLAADLNAEMIEQIARYPRVRDRAIFIGDPEDVAPGTFGPGLPSMPEWTARHYAFSGYITGFDPATTCDPAALRAELGYAPEERVCVVAVGGSGVGAHLMRKVIAAYPIARESIPGLRMIAVAGPRIDPASFPLTPGVEVLPYVDGLYRHLAASDLAIVQGGLTTTMELVAAQRPFLYFPLRDHFEQQIHVQRRLERYRAGRRLAFADATPESIALAMTEDIAKPVAYLPIAPGGARRAAELIAPLL